MFGGNGKLTGQSRETLKLVVATSLSGSWASFSLTAKEYNTAVMSPGLNMGFVGAKGCQRLSLLIKFCSALKWICREDLTWRVSGLTKVMGFTRSNSYYLQNCSSKSLPMKPLGLVLYTPKIPTYFFQLANRRGTENELTQSPGMVWISVASTLELLDETTGSHNSHKSNNSHMSLLKKVKAKLLLK